MSSINIKKNTQNQFDMDINEIYKKYLLVLLKEQILSSRVYKPDILYLCETITTSNKTEELRYDINNRLNVAVLSLK
jgi:hypothetical protein